MLHRVTYIQYHSWITWVTNRFGGGGTVLVPPLLTLFLGIPIAYAAGASLISTIATSSGAASAYIRDKITNVRIGMGLEIATTTGSIVGSLTAAYIYSHSLAWIVYVVFGIVILTSIIPTAKGGVSMKYLIRGGLIEPRRSLSCTVVTTMTH